MNKCFSWGIEGYIVMMNHSPIAQFNSIGWAMEFQKLVSHMHKNVPITIIYADGNSTMVTDDVKEEDEGEVSC